MVLAVAVRDVHVVDAPLEPLQRRRVVADQPEVRAVDAGLDVVQSDGVQEPHHRVDVPHERELEGQHLDGQLHPARAGVLADGAGGLDGEAPLVLGRQELVLEQVLAGNEQDVPPAGVRDEVDVPAAAVDVEAPHRRVEVVEPEGRADHRRRRQPDLRDVLQHAGVGGVVVLHRVPEQVDAVEPHLARPFHARSAVELGVEPGGHDQPEVHDAAPRIDPPSCKGLPAVQVKRAGAGRSMVMADLTRDGSRVLRAGGGIVIAIACMRSQRHARPVSLAIVDNTLFDKWRRVDGRILPPCLHPRAA